MKLRSYYIFIYFVAMSCYIIGDTLAAHGAQMLKYPSLSNVQIRLTYPASGLGAQVTYVNIDIDQVHFG